MPICHNLNFQMSRRPLVFEWTIQCGSGQGSYSLPDWRALKCTFQHYLKDHHIFCFLLPPPEALHYLRSPYEFCIASNEGCGMIDQSNQTIEGHGLTWCICTLWIFSRYWPWETEYNLIIFDDVRAPAIDKWCTLFLTHTPIPIHSLTVTTKQPQHIWFNKNTSQRLQPKPSTRIHF